MCSSVYYSAVVNMKPSSDRNQTGLILKPDRKPDRKPGQTRPDQTGTK